MLTRLQVDGFKNLLDFDCYFGPFTCIAGPNAVGKSNIFDAIEFLSLLADHPFLDAARQLRVRGDQIVDPKHLFWNNADSENPLMTFKAEMIVPNEVEDDFGRIVRPTTTFLTYELHLRYIAPDNQSPQTGRIRLEREELLYIPKGDAAAHLPWPHSAGLFRSKVVTGKRFGAAYISTSEDESGEWVVNVHQDGGSRGRPRPSNPARAPRTIVSTTTSSDDQTILAARREMQGWRMLALEPSAMRSPDNVFDDPHVTENGAHLAASLFRMAHERGNSVYSEVSSAAAALTDIRKVAVDHDERRDSLTLQAQLGNGPILPARSLSDGTLRFLALCIMRADDQIGGLLCMEEPENGIHPGRIEAMVQLVRSLAVDPEDEPGAGNPLRQVLVNTHSPTFVRYQDRSDVLAAMPATIRREGVPTTTVRLMPMCETWRSRKLGIKPISEHALSDFLREPDNALFSWWPGDEQS